MAVKIQLRRGTEAEFDSAHSSSAITPADGEVLVVQPTGTTGGYIVIGDGSSNWAALKADTDARFYYSTGYSNTILGGVQAANATPLTVKGASSQTAAILKVTNNSDNSVLEIYDDEGPVVRLEDHGDVGEVFMRIRGQASGTANILEVQTGESGNATQIAVDADGLVALTPTDNQSADDPTLDVKGSAGSQSNGILRVKKSDNDNVLLVNTDKVVVDGFPVVAQADGDATSNVTLVGSSDAAVKAITVDDGGTENFSVTAGGAIATNGAVTSEGKGTFADAEIDVTDRTTNAASVLRKDEIEATVADTSGPFYYCITRNDNDIPTGSNLLFPFVIGSAPHNFTTSIVGSASPALTLLPITGTNSDIQTGHDSSDNDTTNAYILKLPANSGSLAMRLQYQGPNSSGSDINGTARLRQYTAQTLESSTFEYNIIELVDSEDTVNILTRTAVIPNRTTDKFYAISFDGSHSTSGSSDALHIDLLVARSAGDFECIPDNSDPTSINLKAT